MYLYVSVNLSVRLFICILAYVHVCVRLCVRACMHVCVCVCVYMCVRMCVFTFSKSACWIWPNCSTSMMGEFCHRYCSASVLSFECFSIVVFQTFVIPETHSCLICCSPPSLPLTPNSFASALQIVNRVCLGDIYSASNSISRRFVGLP